ncbi:hypothetical protein [uncultured Sulfitobacter sp.]|uniref:hypothetical protein n=1 Tax=uncultured Sulfitobacter sp. TaxID=191468 RepID=UPI002632AAD4|nr:hypothetical protein [uncultured Sulfitobacter sp.]
MNSDKKVVDNRDNLLRSDLSAVSRHRLRDPSHEDCRRGRMTVKIREECADEIDNTKKIIARTPFTGRHPYQKQPEPLRTTPTPIETRECDLASEPGPRDLLR